MIMKRCIITAKHPSNGTYDVRDPMFNEVYFDCIHIGGNHDHSVPLEFGEMVLLITDENYNYILAYHKNNYSVFEGIHYIFMGDSEAIVYDSDGSFRISKVIKKEDGSVVEIPRLRYDSDKNIDLQLSEYNIAVSGLSALKGELDTLGFYSHKFTTKGRYDDTGIRYKKEIKGGITGIVSTETVDVSPSPIGGVPEKLMNIASPLSLTIDKSSIAPLDISLNTLAVNLANIKIDPIGSITVTSGVAPSGTSVSMSPLGDFEVKNPLAKAKINIDGSIEMSNNIGSIKIDALGSISVNGLKFDVTTPSGSLMTILSAITNLLSTHIHPTGTGPSGPPVSSVAIGAQKTLLDGIKG